MTWRQFIWALSLSVCSLGLHANTLDAIKQHAKQFHQQGVDAYLVVNIPVCNREIFGSRRYVLSLPYHLSTKINIEAVSKIGQSKFRIQLTAGEVVLLDGPERMQPSFSGFAWLDQASLEKADALFVSLTNNDAMASFNLKNAVNSHVASLIHENIVADDAPYTLDVTYGDTPALSALSSPLCDDDLIHIKRSSLASHAVFGRGFMPRKPSQREEDKIFLRDEQGNKLAFAYTSAVSEKTVALLQSAREFSHAEVVEEDPEAQKIVGGEDLLEGDSEFIVAIATRLPNGKFRQFCAGTLVSKRLVLTAAHCNINSRHYVIAGRKRINGDGGSEIKVASVWRHIDFKKRAPYDADIAVLVLASAVNTEDLPIRPIPLIDRNLTPRDDVRVMGWGAKVHGGGRTEQLQFVDLDVLGDDACVAGYTETNLPVTDNMLCASQVGKDACQGDSGGGAYYRRFGIEEAVYLAGIVSYGIGCGSPEYHGVYTRTYNFRDWLDRAVSALVRINGDVNEM